MTWSDILGPCTCGGRMLPQNFQEREGCLWIVAACDRCGDCQKIRVRAIEDV